MSWVVWTLDEVKSSTEWLKKRAATPIEPKITLIHTNFKIREVGCSDVKNFQPWRLVTWQKLSKPVLLLSEFILLQLIFESWDRRLVAREKDLSAIERGFWASALVRNSFRQKEIIFTISRRVWINDDSGLPGIKSACVCRRSLPTYFNTKACVTFVKWNPRRSVSEVFLRTTVVVGQKRDHRKVQKTWNLIKKAVLKWTFNVWKYQTKQINIFVNHRYHFLHSNAIRWCVYVNTLLWFQWARWV